MKRVIALMLAALLLAGLFAACGNKGQEDLPADASTAGATTTTRPTTTLNDLPVAPEGFIRFATLDAANNVLMDDIIAWLKTPTGRSVAVTKHTLMTANVSGGIVRSVTDENSNSFSVFVGEDEAATPVLYAPGGDSSEDPTVIDLTTLGNLAPPAALKPVGTTKPSTKPGATKAPVPNTVAKPSQVTTVPRTTLSEDQQLIIDQKNDIKDSGMSDIEKTVAISLLNFTRDPNGFFFVEHSPWQKQFGFNQIYDLASPLIQLVYGTVRVKFRYGYVYELETAGDNKGQVKYDASGSPIYAKDAKGDPIPKDWMVQMWKGRYGIVMLGAEIGVYTKPSTQTSEHYYSAVTEEELIFAMDVYQQNFITGQKKLLFKRTPESHWWLTGFVPGTFYQYNNKNEIIMVCNIQFPNPEMVEAFRAAFEKCGFSAGSPGRDNPETYTVSGNQLKFSWQYIDEDA